jgi:hypothetical protein
MWGILSCAQPAPAQSGGEPSFCPYNRHGDGSCCTRDEGCRSGQTMTTLGTTTTTLYCMGPDAASKGIGCPGNPFPGPSTTTTTLIWYCRWFGYYCPTTTTSTTTPSTTTTLSSTPNGSSGRCYVGEANPITGQLMPAANRGDCEAQGGTWVP